MATSRKKPPNHTVVLFVRHGQTPTTGKQLPGRAPGLHLAEEGQRQAKAVAARIAELPRVDAIYASPLERAQETAEPIAAARQLTIEPLDDLVDCDFGDWTGAELKALMKLPEWKTVQSYPSGFRFPRGESFAEMQTRMVSAVMGIVDRHKGGLVVAVSHADPIKAVVAHAVGSHLDLFQRIFINTCSVTAIAYSPLGPVVLTVNSTDGSLTQLKPS
jgi:probable phosphomutase (TIGR03848 family)